MRYSISSTSRQAARSSICNDRWQIESGMEVQTCLLREAIGALASSQSSGCDAIPTKRGCLLSIPCACCPNTAAVKPLRGPVFSYTSLKTYAQLQLQCSSSTKLQTKQLAHPHEWLIEQTSRAVPITAVHRQACQTQQSRARQ